MIWKDDPRLFHFWLFFEILGGRSDYMFLWYNETIHQVWAKKIKFDMRAEPKLYISLLHLNW